MGNSRRIGSKASTASTEYSKKAIYFTGKAGSYEWSQPRINKRFETTGQISLISLTKIAMALDIADELRSLFLQVPYRNIQEVLNETK